MSARGTRNSGAAAFAVAIVAAVLMAGTGPGVEPAAAEGAAEDCQFALLASNNFNHSVSVLLYDSEVRKDGVGFGIFTPGWKQLKIQNERIKPGGTMNRRYTASGKCSAKRIWRIKAVRGDPGRVQSIILRFETSGTWSGSRTVDLGPATKWDPID